MSKKKYLSNSELSAFCQQIVMVLQAGLPTYYGISILADEAPDEKTKELLLKIYKPMEVGGTLHDSLKESGLFPPYMVKMIALGEATGKLEDVLQSLTVFYEKEETIRANVKSAVTYPLILTLLMFLVIIIMIAKVLPVFSQIYEELGSELTGSAALLMTISNAINKYLVIIIVAIVVIAAFLAIFYRTKPGKKIFQGSGLPMSIAASRFANCMALALSSGLDTQRGLELAQDLIDNPHMQEKIAACSKDIKDGVPLSKSLLDAEIFDKQYSSLISIGTKTGAMDDVMKNICETYENDTDERLSRFINALEPSLVIVLCVFIGLILITFLLPMLGIMSSIG